MSVFPWQFHCPFGSQSLLAVRHCTLTAGKFLFPKVLFFHCFLTTLQWHIYISFAAEYVGKTCNFYQFSTCEKDMFSTVIYKRRESLKSFVFQIEILKNNWKFILLTIQLLFISSLTICHKSLRRRRGLNPGRLRGSQVMNPRSY